MTIYCELFAPLFSKTLELITSTCVLVPVIYMSVPNLKKKMFKEMEMLKYPDLIIPHCVCLLGYHNVPPNLYN